MDVIHSAPAAGFVESINTGGDGPGALSVFTAGVSSGPVPQLL